MGAFDGVLEALGGLLVAFEDVLEALEGVLEAEVRQDTAKMATRRPKSEKPRESPSGLSLRGRLLGALEGVLEALGGILEASEGVLEALGGALEAEVREDTAKMASRPPKSEKPRELPSGSKLPGCLLRALEGVLEALGGPLKACWRLLEAPWRPKCAKIPPRWPQDRPRAKNLENYRAH